MLLILDGWGSRAEAHGNAIAAAKPPYWNRLLASHPQTTLQCAGRAVGLPDDQFGNSEVGHLNLGSGRVVYQEITRIDAEIESGAFQSNAVLTEAIAALPPGRRVHLMGLIGDGGVHAIDRHYVALLRLLKREGIDGGRVCFHAITDGRDTSPGSARRHMADLLTVLEDENLGAVATVSGRYFAMDRDTNWERTARYYDLLTLGEGGIAPDPMTALEDGYAAGRTDEFFEPVLIASHGRPLGRIERGDVLLAFNFRADRMRQICRALVEGDAFDSACFRRKARPAIALTTMTPYLKGLAARTAYQPQSMRNTLAEVVSGHGLKQFRCAETEKYAHVTYFFNGGQEQPGEGEVRELVPSPKVATYDLQPEMNLPEVARRVADAAAGGTYPLIVSNYANGDMVGHTGVFSAAVAAVGAIDQALELTVETALRHGYRVLITADHGNCEEMLAPDGSALTNHSFNPVPLVWVDRGDGRALASGGALCDVAPTVLALMGLPQPPEMTGRVLLSSVQ